MQWLYEDVLDYTEKSVPLALIVNSLFCNLTPTDWFIALELKIILFDAKSEKRNNFKV